MKTLKSLLLGSSVAAFAAVGAQAADLIAEPAAEYVRVCDAYGSGFHYIPGTQTCLKIGGSMQYWTFFNNNRTRVAGVTTGGRFGYDQGAMARLNLDARSQTELGTLRGFLEVQYNFNSAVHGNNSVTTRFAFIQLGGFTAGQTNSFFHIPGVTNMWNAYGIGASTAPQRVPLVAYTFAAGGGFSATISLEDAQTTGVSGVTSIRNLNGLNTQTLPLLVGRVDYRQSWGSVRVMGLFSNNGRTAAVAGNKIRDGFAIGAGAELNVVEGGVLSLGAAYYSGFANRGNYGPAQKANGTSAAQSWRLHADYRQRIASNLSASIGGVFTRNEYAKINGYQIISTLQYQPVAGLNVGLEVYYTNAEFRVGNVPAGARGRTEGFGGAVAIQRSF